MATVTTNKESLLRLLLQTCDQGVMILDSRGQLLGVSQVLCDMLGYDWRDLVGCPAERIVPAADNEDISLAPPPEQGEVRLNMRDSSGERISTVWNFVPCDPSLHSGPGECGMHAAYLDRWLGTPGSGRDSFLDETVRENLCDSLPIGVLVTDRNGDIVLYNSFQEKITGVPQDESVGSRLFRDYGAQAPEKVKESFARALREKVVGLEHEFDYTDRFGTTRRYRSRISSLTGPDNEIHGVVQTLEDMSEPMLLQQEIDRTRGILRRLLDSTPNPIMTTDMEGRIIFHNHAAREVLKFEPAENRDFFLADFFLAGRREAEQVIAYLDECEGRVEDYETYFQDLEGNEIPVSLTLSYLYEDGSRTAGVLIIARNLSRMKKLESEVRRNEHFLATFIQNSPDAVITLDNEGRVKTWNHGAERMFGYRSEEMSGKPLDQLLPGDAGLVDMPHFGDVEFDSNGSLKHYTTELVKSTGERLVVEATSTELGRESGGLRGRLIIFRDVTLRDQLERVLKENIADLSTINEISEALLTSKDLDEILEIILIGVTAGQGLGFNRAFLLLIDYDEQALVGRLAIGPSNPEHAGVIWSEVSGKYHSLREIFEAYKNGSLDHDSHVNEIVRDIRIPLKGTDNPLVRACVEKKSLNIVNGVSMGTFPEPLARVLGTDTMAIVPLVCEHRSVGLILADNMINRRPIDEEAVRKLRVFANLASQTIERSRLYLRLEEQIAELDRAYMELKESRDKLVQAERLAALGQLATQVAHEIRNPLVSIGGFARALHKGFGDGDPRREKTGIIVEEVDRLERYLKDTLTFIRPKNPILRPAEPNHLIVETVRMLDSEIEQSHVLVDLELMESPPQIEMDSDLIRQVLLNIIRNALEAMPEGGTLTVGTRDEDDGSFRIEIADTGCGIDQQHINKLFTAFFTTKTTGSGLGLAISNQIVKDHGGGIEIESEPGEGSLFRIILPQKHETESEVDHEEITDRR